MLATNFSFNNPCLLLIKCQKLKNTDVLILKLRISSRVLLRMNELLMTLNDAVGWCVLGAPTSVQSKPTYNHWPPQNLTHNQPTIDQKP